MTQELLKAYDTLFQSLWERMSNMLGRIATNNMMERALFVTAKEYPLAKEIELQSHSIDLSAFYDKSDEISAEELRDTMNALIVNIVGVLAEQVGVSIARSLAKKAVIPDEEAE